MRAGPRTRDRPFFLGEKDNVADTGRPKKWTQAAISKMARAIVEFFESDETRLFTEEFCIAQNISRQRLSEWEKINSEFSDALEHVRQVQTVRLAKNGLMGLYNPKICSLVMANVIGWSEKQEIKQSGTLTLLAPEAIDKPEDAGQ